MTQLDESEVYARIGAKGFEQLCRGFYLQVPNDPILGPMYPEHDMAGAEDRLRKFLEFRFGGPETYLEERGHPRLRMRHNPFPIDQAARDRWIELMSRSLQECQFDDDVRQVILAFFEHAATFLINRIDDH